MFYIKKMFLIMCLVVAGNAVYDAWPFRFFFAIPLFSTNGMLTALFCLFMVAGTFAAVEIRDIK